MRLGLHAFISTSQFFNTQVNEQMSGEHKSDSLSQIMDKLYTPQVRAAEELLGRLSFISHSSNGGTDAADHWQVQPWFIGA